MGLNKLAELVIVRNQLALLEGNTVLVGKDIRREVSDIKLKMDRLFLEEVVKLNQHARSHKWSYFGNSRR